VSGHFSDTSQIDAMANRGGRVPDYLWTGIFAALASAIFTIAAYKFYWTNNPWQFIHMVRFSLLCDRKCFRLFLAADFKIEKITWYYTAKVGTGNK
jgi:hypothetical protein